jgi:ABC-type cobalamin/Fe3+-siderophores transport system ATPase subunit
VQVLDRNVENLSGGELQRFAIAVVAAQTADVYMIDEPSSYLDVRQRLKAAKVSKAPHFGATSVAAWHATGCCRWASRLRAHLESHSAQPQQQG